ncbi:MAG: hypothetical protein ACO3AG_03625 [Fluviibacter sp.]
MSKYRAIYDRKGLLAEYENEELVWVRQELDKTRKAKHQIMLDIQPYKSMVDGSMITSRSQHREHLRRHNCFEVGNEKMETKRPTPISREKRIKILREQLWNVSDRDCDRVLDQIRRR